MSLDVILGFDASVSMKTKEGNTTRIGAVKELATSIIKKACELDEDGPDAFTFGERVTSLGNITADDAVAKLQSIAADEYATNLGAFLVQAFKKAKDKIGQGSRVLVLAFTDGAASDAKVVESQIASMADWMTEDAQCALEIIYVGDEAESYLKKLDDDLNTKFDIVDATPINEAIALGVEELLNKAFND
jgi:Mg-chelatase subunit ChlD